MKFDSLVGATSWPSSMENRASTTMAIKVRMQHPLLSFSLLFHSFFLGQSPIFATLRSYVASSHVFPLSHMK